MKLHYPCWRYHATKEACVVQDEAEEAALGEGWENTPAAFEDEAAEKVQEILKDAPKAGPITTAEAPKIIQELVLRDQAKELGIKVDGRWSQKRLRKEIDAARKRNR